MEAGTEEARAEAMEVVARAAAAARQGDGDETLREIARGECAGGVPLMLPTAKLDRMYVTDLRAACCARGLSGAGRKVELRARLLPFAASDHVEAMASAAAAALAVAGGKVAPLSKGPSAERVALRRVDTNDREDLARLASVR